MLLADRVGLVNLIAGGYRALAALLILLYVIPLLLAVMLRHWRQPRIQPELP